MFHAFVAVHQKIHNLRRTPAQARSSGGSGMATDDVCVAPRGPTKPQSAALVGRPATTRQFSRETRLLRSEANPGSGRCGADGAEFWWDVAAPAYPYLGQLDAQQKDERGVIGPHQNQRE